MASLHQHHSNYDRVFLGPIFSDSPRRRGSTSQMCLHKILSIITTVPPPPSTACPPFSGSETKESSAENDASDENKGSNPDLNVGFRISPELKESFEGDNSSGSSFSSTTDGLGCRSSVRDGGCFKVNLGNGRDRVGREDSSNIKTEEGEKSLTLLIEAATLIFGEFKDDDKPESEKQDFCRDSEVKKDEVAADIELNERKLRRQCTAAEMGGEFEENPARSKRGRTRVLPCKYRDSVLEPLTRLSKPRSPILPSKRRRR